MITRSNSFDLHIMATRVYRINVNISSVSPVTDLAVTYTHSQYLVTCPLIVAVLGGLDFY